MTSVIYVCCYKTLKQRVLIPTLEITLLYPSELWEYLTRREDLNLYAGVNNTVSLDYKVLTHPAYLEVYPSHWVLLAVEKACPLYPTKPARN